MKSIAEIKSFDDKKVLVRTDWNVPMNEKGEVLDSSRIAASLETIKYIKDNGGIPVIMSHFGRERDSIEPVFEYARECYPILREGVDFLPNLRQNPGEEANGEEFAKELASKGDIYVNGAFSASHRRHASIVGVPRFLPSYAGFNFMREVECLSKAFNPPHPFLLILGGAKLETKLPMVEKFMDIADGIFVGGALAAYEAELPENPKIIHPLDPDRALDAGESTIKMLEERIKESKFVLWNGPLGKFEEGHTKGTEELAKILAESDAEVIVGGGDTLAAIKNLNLKDKFSFVSTGGGAMLEFLAKGTLPGIIALG